MNNLGKSIADINGVEKQQNDVGDGPQWYTYLLTCTDGSLYCGITIDIGERLKAHNSGIASKYTRSRRPVSLSVLVGPMRRSEALKLEIRTKRLPRDKKIGFLRVYESAAMFS